MEPAKIREAAQLVRSSWRRTGPYAKDGTMCTVGAIAKAFLERVADRHTKA